jgi:hypothetical protein
VWSNPLQGLMRLISNTRKKMRFYPGARLFTIEIIEQSSRYRMVTIAQSPVLVNTKPVLTKRPACASMKIVWHGCRQMLGAAIFMVFKTQTPDRNSDCVCLADRLATERR